jgi:hypothetical protein
MIVFLQGTEIKKADITVYHFKKDTLQPSKKQNIKFCEKNCRFGIREKHIMNSLKDGGKDGKDGGKKEKGKDGKGEEKDKKDEKAGEGDKDKKPEAEKKK